MRLAVIAVLTIVLSANAFGDAVVGKTHILIDGHTPYWVPIRGGPATALLPMNQSGGTGAHYDEHFFLIWADEKGLRAGLFEEAAIVPLSATTLEPDPGGRPSRSVWDGTRHIVAWYRRQDHVHGAALTPQGVIVKTFSAPDVRNVHGLAVSNGQLLLLENGDITSNPRRRVIDGDFFDANLTFTKRIRLSEIAFPGGLSVTAAVPFADGFYVAAVRTTGSTWTLIGFQILSDGTKLAEKVLDPNVEGVADVDLVKSGERLLAVVKRFGVGPVTGTLIEDQGSVVGPFDLGAEIELRFDVRSAAEAVRLQDGSLAIVSVLDGAGSVTPIRESPPDAPQRRRAVRR